MEEKILVTRNLKKQYGNFVALNNVNISIEKGQIYGLVGRNGAGKTTLLRLITGQTLQNGGELQLFHETTEAGLNKVRKRTGAIIETPGFIPYFTAKQNLEYYRLQRGIAGKECIDSILQEVGLSDTGKKNFKDFSLGMKQRLGLALAMMNNPDFLILDEPINGLDPMGIAEIRHLILRLNEEKGITVIISSHILTELSTMATHYGFIEKGNILEEISAAELHDKCKECLEIKVDDASKLTALLEKELNCTEYQVFPNNLIKVYKFTENPSIVSTLIVNNNIKLLSINVKGTNLEDYFINLIGGQVND